MLAFHNYHRLWSILVIDLSHFWSVILLAVLSFTFIQWLRIVKSYTILIYVVVFGVILFLTLITIPLLTEQFNYQSQLVYPRDYATLIVTVTVPSKDIAFLYGLGNYVLPVLLIASWILTVSILKPYMARIGKSRFWLLVSVPLLYQIFVYIIRDANLATIPGLIDIIYTRQFQFFLGISYQISGLLLGGNNTSMAENYYLFFKPLPVGDHTINVEVIRQPLQANQPVEHDVAKWDMKVVP